MIYEGKEYIIRMEGKDFHCALDVAMNYLGGKWKTIILWYLKDGVKRFNELKKMIPGITERMLTLQLRELESDGFVLRTMYPQIPPKVEYALTDHGHSIIPVLDGLANWSLRICTERGEFVELKIEKK